MEIKLGTNQILLVLIGNTVIAAINAPVSDYKIETAIGEHGCFEEVHIMEQNIEIDFTMRLDYEHTVEFTIKPDEEPENDYIENIKLTAVTIY